MRLRTNSCFNSSERGKSVYYMHDADDQLWGLCASGWDLNANECPWCEVSTAHYHQMERNSAGFPDFHTLIEMEEDS